jgi:hypothetical protein
MRCLLDPLNGGIGNIWREVASDGGMIEIGGESLVDECIRRPESEQGSEGVGYCRYRGEFAMTAFGV